MSDCKMVAFVIHSYSQEVIVDLIKGSYLSGSAHDAAKCKTITEAVEWLRSPQGQQSEYAQIEAAG